MLRYIILLICIVSCSSETSETSSNPNVPPQQGTSGSSSSGGGASGSNQGDQNIINILFIGNSLTYYNEGVNEHVQHFYNKSLDTLTYNVTASTGSAFSLRSHLLHNPTRAAIANRNWDYIILQENGVVATTNPEETYESVVLLKELIEPTGAQGLFYMTWAYDGMPEMTEKLDIVYEEASALTGYKVVKVGWAWKDFLNLNTGIDLLISDGVHPSKSGTYLASCMFFSGISGWSLVDNPYNYDLTPDNAQLIKQHITQSLINYPVE